MVVCLGFEPGAAEGLPLTIPRSYGDHLKELGCFSMVYFGLNYKRLNLLYIDGDIQ